MTDKQGFVLAYRKAWYHPVFSNLLEGAIWNYLYQNAFWKDGEKNINGYVFSVKRGEIAVTISYLAKGFCTTEKGVRRVIQKLEKYGMVVTRGTSRGTIITICNYDKYQHLENAEGEPRANNGRTEGEPRGNNKKERNNKTTKEDYTVEFSDFWSAYPKRDGSNPKKPAMTKFIDACKNHDPQEIILGAKKYAAQEKRRGNIGTSYVAQAQTWLNQERWKDDYDTGQNERKNYIGM